MSVKKISEAILGVGVDDTTIDLFESQYPVPTGVSYNSYVILDEKTAVLDTVDARATEPPNFYKFYGESCQSDNKKEPLRTLPKGRCTEALCFC